MFGTLIQHLSPLSLLSLIAAGMYCRQCRHSHASCLWGIPSALVIKIHMYILVHFNLKYNQTTSPFPFLSPAPPILKLIVYFSLNNVYSILCIYVCTHIQRKIRVQIHKCQLVLTRIPLKKPQWENAKMELAYRHAYGRFLLTANRRSPTS